MNPFVILDEAQIKRLKRAVGSEYDLIVGLGDWLSHLNLFSDAQVYDILKFFRKQIELFSDAHSIGLVQPATMLAVCDSRWVSITGGNQFWDAKESTPVDSLGEFALTHIMCDLAALRTRILYRQGRGQHESQEQPVAGHAGPARENS
jgi:hypothetical protein